MTSIELFKFTSMYLCIVVTSWGKNFYAVIRINIISKELLDTVKVLCAVSFLFQEISRLKSSFGLNYIS